MKKFTAFSKKLLKNKRGQGMVEYILLLVVVVGIVLIMKDRLTGYVQDNLWGSLSGKMSEVIGN